jgi:hypothetical protein
MQELLSASLAKEDNDQGPKPTNLDVGLTKIPPNVGKQRPGAAQSISRMGTGSTPMSRSIFAWEKGYTNA